MKFRQFYLASIVLISFFLMLPAPSVQAQQDDFFPIGLWGMGATPILTENSTDLPTSEKNYLNLINANCMEHHMLDDLGDADEFISYEHPIYKDFCNTTRYKMVPTWADGPYNNQGYCGALYALLNPFGSCSSLYNDDFITNPTDNNSNGVDDYFEARAELSAAEITGVYSSNDNVTYGYMLAHEGYYYKDGPAATPAEVENYINALNYLGNQVKIGDPTHKVIIIHGIQYIDDNFVIDDDSHDVLELIDDTVDVFQYEEYPFSPEDLTYDSASDVYQNSLQGLIDADTWFGIRKGYDNCMNRILKNSAVDMEWEAIIQAKASDYHHHRWPTMAEMKVQAYLALSRGATGIWYYLWADHFDPGAEVSIMNYPINPNAPDPVRHPRVLDRPLAPPDSFYFSGLSDLNDSLMVLGPVFKSLTIHDAKNADDIHLISDYITNVAGERKILNNSKSAIEAGLFHDDFGDEYVVFVNRMCNNADGSPAGPDTFWVHLSGDSTYLVEDVLISHQPDAGPVDGLFYAYGDEVPGMPTWQVLLGPGEGRLFRLTPGLRDTIPGGVWRGSMTVAGDVVLPGPENLTISTVPPYRVQVRIAAQSQLEMIGSVDASRCDFSPLEIDPWYRFLIRGQGAFSDCTFDGCATVFRVEPHAALDISSDCEFENYETAIAAANALLNIGQSSFQGGIYGVVSSGGRLTLWNNSFFNHSSCALKASYPPQRPYDLQGNLMQDGANGILAYGGAMLNVTNGNVIQDNENVGIALANGASLVLERSASPDSTTAHNYIQNNGGEEIYFMSGAAMDMAWGENFIISEPYVPGTPDEYLVYRYHRPDLPDESRLVHLEWNNWGTIADTTTFAARFQPGGYERFSILPVWPGDELPPAPPPKILYRQSVTAMETGYYDQARNGFQALVALYPASEQAPLSLQQLLVVEQWDTQDYQGLISYYESHPHKTEFPGLNKVSEQLITLARVQAENYPVAIDRLETVVENPPSLVDSVFAVIDLGWVYLQMNSDQSDSTASSQARPGGLYCPIDLTSYQQNTELLLARIGLVPPPEIGADTRHPTAKETWLAQNFPNPFNAATTIRYQIPHRGQVRLDIYNMAGQRVTTLVNRPEDAGQYGVRWDGRNSKGQAVSSGIYYYRLEVDGISVQKRMVLLK